MRRSVLYVNAIQNSDTPPWRPAERAGWIKASTYSNVAGYAEGNKKVPGSELHCAILTNGNWTAFYRWDAKKQKFVCTRYRDVLRKLKKQQAVTSDA